MVTGTTADVNSETVGETPNPSFWLVSAKPQAEAQTDQRRLSALAALNSPAASTDSVRRIDALFTEEWSSGSPSCSRQACPGLGPGYRVTSPREGSPAPYLSEVRFEPSTGLQTLATLQPVSVPHCQVGAMAERSAGRTSAVSERWVRGTYRVIDSARDTPR